MSRGWWIWKIPMVIVIGIAALFLFGYVTQTLWNWLVPALFGGPALTFWQALGLLALSKILFSGFGGRRHGWGGQGGGWGYYWKRKWDRMTPEERERFREKLKDKWCYTDKSSSPADPGVQGAGGISS